MPVFTVGLDAGTRNSLRLIHQGSISIYSRATFPRLFFSRSAAGLVVLSANELWVVLLCLAF